MNKISEFDKTRLLPALAIEKLFKKELGKHIKRKNEERFQLMREQISSAYLASRKAESELAIKIAEFRMKHSVEINKALLSDPRFVQNFVSRHLVLNHNATRAKESGNLSDDIPEVLSDNPLSGNFLSSIMVMEKYYGYNPGLGLEIGNPWVVFGPQILSFPARVSVGEQSGYTITGERFGNNPGSLNIIIYKTGLQINPVIMSWTDTAIMFKISDNVAGVSFDAEACLSVTNDKNFTNEVNLIVDPLASVSIYHCSFKDKGQNYNFSDYEYSGKLFSAVLPLEYKLFDAPSLNSPGINLHISTYTYLIPQGTESEASFELISGPEECALFGDSTRFLEVTVKVYDDFYWDYELFADFMIIVPKGIPTPGWIN